MHRNYPWLLILLTGLWLVACAGPEPTPTPTADPQAAGETPSDKAPSDKEATNTPPPKLVYALSPLQPATFGDVPSNPVTVEPQVPDYDTNPQSAKNAKLLDRLSPAQQTALQENGFVIVPAEHAQFYDLYKQANQRGEPVFVTVDVILHAYHIVYDYTLRYLEIENWVEDLDGLNRAMIRAAEQQVAETAGKTREAARRNLAFFAVADMLLNPAHKPPEAVADLVEAELSKIEARQGLAQSPIFGYKEDYSQYVPRGHYTRNETFRRYFKVMMWYGRMLFRLRPGETEAARDAGRRETRQAILITASLQEAKIKGRSALDTWERIYEPTVFFVGRADDLTVYDYTEAIRKIYGKTLALNQLNDMDQLDRFIELALTLRPPRIVSSYVTDQENPETVTKGFRFMGQRFIPDSYIFQQLVYPKVGTAQNPRLFPKGLDVAAVLTSERAYEILDQVYSETSYANYAAQMAALREEFAALPAEQWTENLYWSWLHTLRPLLEPKSSAYPTFMTNQTWQDKNLNSFLGSWTELRHDTILYAKQSYTLKATGIMPEPEPVVGYVEPEPALYARLASLITQMRTGLEARGLLNAEYRTKLERMEELVLVLQRIAEKELVNQPISDQEADLLRRIGARLESITTFSTVTEEKITSEADTRAALVADVHTDVNTNQVLEEAIGDVFEIYVLTPHPDHTTISVGGVFSYYEFTQPLEDRLTDEAWQAMETRPKPPVWTERFK